MKKSLALLLLTSLFLIGCTAGTPSNTEEVDLNLPPETKADEEITVVGKEFSFSPEMITVEEGQKVKITFKNEGEMPHDFVIKGEGVILVKTPLVQPGEEETVVFQAPDEGEYKFICTVSGHESQGMKGKFIVE